MLYEKLPSGSLARALAETLSDAVLMTPDGYVRILEQILMAYQAYLEVELERTTLEFLYPRGCERGELFNRSAHSARP